MLCRKRVLDDLAGVRQLIGDIEPKWSKGNLVLVLEVHRCAFAIEHADRRQPSMRLGAVLPPLHRLRCTADVIGDAGASDLRRLVVIDVCLDLPGVACPAGTLQYSRVAGLARTVVTVDDGQALGFESQCLTGREIVRAADTGN